jgi:hypothetical protein
MGAQTKLVVRVSSIVKVSNSSTVWIYQCHICGKKLIHDGLGRIIQAIKLHYRNKHNIIVEVVD